MRRVTLFVKGNVDVHDSLHSCRVAGNLLWNGINELLREHRSGSLIRIRHETWTRSDALLECNGIVPQAFDGRNLPLGAYPLASQFSDAIYTTNADAIVLSLQADVTTSLVTHSRDNFLFYPNNLEAWSSEDRAWLKSQYENSAPLDVDIAISNLAAIIAKIRQSRDIPILIYNLSPIIPGDHIHCYMGFGDALSVRIRRFNLALIELSEQSGISVVDVDAIVARHGADELKLDGVHLNPKGYSLVANEVVRVLDDLGVLEEQP